MPSCDRSTSKIVAFAGFIIAFVCPKNSAGFIFTLRRDRGPAKLK